jgi:hypothetical protein
MGGDYGYEGSLRGGENYGTGYGSLDGSGYGSNRGFESRGEFFGDPSRGSVGSGHSWRAVGERGRFSGKGPKGYQRSDDRIKEDVSDLLEREGELDASEIEVQVSSGEVTLTGTVSDRFAKRLAEDLIEDLPGVKQVHNRLRVGNGFDTSGSASSSGRSGSSRTGASSATSTKSTGSSS